MPLHLNHVAHPCFDVAATHRIYGGVLGLRVSFALESERELRWAYTLSGDDMLVFVTREGRPEAASADWDGSHVGLVVASREERTRLKGELLASGIALHVEDEGPDERLYFRDPNGLVVEIETAFEPARTPDADAAVLRWTDPIG